MNLNTVWEFMEKTRVLGFTLADLAGRGLYLAVVTALAYVADRTLSRLVGRALKSARVPSVSIIVNMVRALIWFLALLTVLEPVFGVQPTAFVAALGVGSLALSLGLQDTVSNTVGGLSLMLTKVIQPGDVITFGGFTGVVTDINWRSTCIADSYGQVNIIPNSIISKTALLKLSPATRSCCVLPLFIEHGSNLEEARKDLRRVAKERLGDWVDPERDVWITVTSMDPGAIIAQVSVPLMWGVSADHARTRLAEGLSAMDWVRKP